MVYRSFPQMAHGVGYDTLIIRWFAISIPPPWFLTVKRQVINTGDMLDFLTGGFYKPTIHRVVQPPHDQSAYDRLGAFYFSAPDDNVRLSPLSNSPVLQRVGIERRWPDEEAPLAAAWMKERTITYGRAALKKGSENNTEEEVIAGVVVKHYN